MADYSLGRAVGTIVISTANLSAAQKAVRSLATGMIGIGGAAVAGVGVAVYQAAKFEAIMSGAQAALGATAKEMEPVKQAALDMGAASVYGAKNVGLAFEQLAYAGFSAQEIIKGVGK